MGEATAEGGEVAYLRHAEVGVEENPGTLRCALRTGLRKSAVALRRESANRGLTFIQPLFGGRLILSHLPPGRQANLGLRLYNRPSAVASHIVRHHHLIAPRAQ